VRNKDSGPTPVLHGTLVQVAVHVSLRSAGSDEVKSYAQKRAPLRPDWQSCFDAHLYRGRTFEMIVMQRSEQKVGSVRVSAQSLAEHCTNIEHIATVWVSQSARNFSLVISCHTIFSS